MMTHKPSCQRCGRRLGHAGACGNCLKNPGFIDQTISLVPYAFPTNSLLRSMKYKDKLMLAHEFGEKLAQKVLSENLSMPERIIPVPLHPKRLISRGFNQAIEVARKISKETGVPLDYWSCVRIKNTLPQFSLKSAQRRKNLINSFKNKGLSDIKTVAIVDGITTTGRTANELAKDLKSCGISKVSLWVCAHAG
jgi:ComF family protein